MKRNGRQFAVAIAVILGCTGVGYAQLPANPEVPASTRTVNLSLEQRHTIRELVKELKIEPVSPDLKVSAGDTVPQKVELRPIPPLIGEKVPQIKAHRFYLTARQIVIVDPKDDKIVEVIE